MTVMQMPAEPAMPIVRATAQRLFAAMVKPAPNLRPAMMAS
jgi:hypothetical protein